MRDDFDLLIDHIEAHDHGWRESRAGEPPLNWSVHQSHQCSPWIRVAPEPLQSCCSPEIIYRPKIARFGAVRARIGDPKPQGQFLVL